MSLVLKEFINPDIDNYDPGKCCGKLGTLYGK